MRGLTTYKYISLQRLAAAEALRFPDVLDAMGEALRHRGPDGRAFFASPRARIGTERLRIIDLHERADQPFASPDDLVWLEANGEIYNAASIRARAWWREMAWRW